MSEFTLQLHQIINKITDFFSQQVELMTQDPIAYFLKLILIVIALYCLTLFLKNINLLFEFIKNKKLEKNGVLLKILVKKTTTAKDTEALIRNLHSVLLNTNYRALIHGRPYLNFEIVAEEDKLTFYTWVPKDYKDLIVERIYATYSECSLMECEDYLPNRVWMNITDWIEFFKVLKERIKYIKRDREKMSIFKILKILKKEELIKIPKNHISIYGTEMELSYHHIFSLNKTLEKEDILESFIAGMKNMEWHEKAVLQILARPVNNTWQEEGTEVLADFERKGIRPKKKRRFKFSSSSNSSSKLKDEWEEELEKQFGGLKLGLGRKNKDSNKKTRKERKEISGATDKILDAGLETSIRVLSYGHYKKQSRARLKMLSAAFNELDKENKFKRRIIFNKRYFYKRIKRRRINLIDRKNILTPEELSKFFLRLPNETTVDMNPEIQALVVKEFAPPRNVETKKFLIGANTYRGKETLVGLKIKDMLRHIILQGKTGTGKSEWAKGFMKQLMEAGCGLALLEPHGKLATETLALIPEERRKDVIIFDLFDDYPTPFNFCKIKKIPGIRLDETIEKTAKEIIDINKRQFSEAWSGKNAYYLENSIKGIIEMNEGNYVDIRRLFYDKDYRELAIKEVRDPQIKHFLRTEFATNAKGEIPQNTQSTINSIDYKLGSFLNSKSLLRSIGQDDCIDFKDVLDSNKILIFRFDKQRMSEDQIKFLGGITLRLLMIEAYRRNKSQWGTPFCILIDEAENYVTEDMKTILYELRKYGVFLTMMHQALEQMNKVKGLTDAIYGSVGTIITLTAGKPDAPFFQDVFEPRLDKKDLTRLPSRYGYVKLMVDGQTSETFNMCTLDSPRVTKTEGNKSYTEILLNNRKGRMHYKEIDKAIAKRLGSLSDEEENNSYYEEIGENDEDWGEDTEITVDEMEDINEDIVEDLNGPAATEYKKDPDPPIKIKDLIKKNKSSSDHKPEQNETEREIAASTMEKQKVIKLSNYKKEEISSSGSTEPEKDKTEEKESFRVCNYCGREIKRGRFKQTKNGKIACLMCFAAGKHKEEDPKPIEDNISRDAKELESNKVASPVDKEVNLWDEDDEDE